MNEIDKIFSALSPMIDLVSHIETEIRSLAFMGNISTSVMKVVETTRELRILAFGLHSYQFIDRGVYLLKKTLKGEGKERIITLVQMTRFTGNLLEDSALMVVGLKAFGVVSAKVVSVVGIISFVGMAIQTVSIGIDALRIYQSIREYMSLKADGSRPNLDRGRRISFKALYGLKRSAIHAKHQGMVLRSHLKKRLIWNIAFRSIAIVAAIVGIVALAVFMFAPTPVVPLAWGLIATTALISIGLVAGKLIVNYHLNREFKELDGKK